MVLLLGKHEMPMELVVVEVEVLEVLHGENEAVV
jgi:hypothetical protein